MIPGVAKFLAGRADRKTSISKDGSVVAIKDHQTSRLPCRLSEGYRIMDIPSLAIRKLIIFFRIFISTIKICSDYNPNIGLNYGTVFRPTPQTPQINGSVFTHFRLSLGIDC